MEPAIFLSRTAGLLAAIKVGRARGLSDQDIQSKTGSFPVYRRGEHQGFTVKMPHPVWGIRKAITEQEVADHV